MKHFLLLIILLLIASVPSRAGHLIGGELSYICLGNDQYVITYKSYRDCITTTGVQQFDPFARVGAYNASTGQYQNEFVLSQVVNEIELEFSSNIPCLVDTPNLCIAQMIYRDTVSIVVPSQGLDLVHQRCCRPPTAVNVNNPDDYGSTYWAQIPPPGVAPCNSSPQFNTNPPIAFCLDLYQSIDFGATDLDGDSLVYTFCTPFDGNGAVIGGTHNDPPFQAIPWSVGFNVNYQISSAPAFTINPSTGELYGRPSQIGSYAFGVCVSEYRNGVFLSENKRDFQVTTTLCEVDAASAIDSLLEECVGFDVQFFNQSTQGNNFLWDFGDLATTNDTSSAGSPIYTYPDTGLYQVRLVAFGDVCSDTSYIEYRVLPKIEAFFEPPSPECFDRQKFEFDAGGFFKSSTIFSWQFGLDTGETVTTDTKVGPIKFPGVGKYEVKVQYEDFGCTKNFSDSIEVWPNPQMSFLPGKRSSCSPFSGRYEVETVDANEPLFYWYADSNQFSNNDTAFFATYDTGSYDLDIRLITDSLCIDTVDIHLENYITVLDTPIAAFYFENYEVDMFTPVFELYDVSENSTSVKYFLGTEFLTEDPNYSFSLLDTGNYSIWQVAKARNLCTDTSFLDTIRVKPRYLAYVPNSFSPDGDGINDLWFPEIFVSKTYALTIYNRWGKIIFTSNIAKEGWNGKINNEDSDCQIGTYFFTLFTTDEDGLQWYHEGKVNLIR
jgi:gliding motility-associated-like protein